MKRFFFLAVLLPLFLSGCFGVPAVRVEMETGTKPDTGTQYARDQHNQFGIQISGVSNSTITITSPQPSSTNDGVVSPLAGPFPPPVSGDLKNDDDALIYAAKSLLRKHEGLRLKPGQEVGGLHIGYGRNLTERGISLKEAELLIDDDVLAAVEDLWVLFHNFRLFPFPIQVALTDMHHQHGPARFRKYKNMIAAARDLDWPRMAEEMKNSKWAIRHPVRAGDLIKLTLKAAAGKI